MFRRHSVFLLCQSQQQQQQLSSSHSSLRARKWLTVHPIEKWTAILDTAANINTLLDDDLWKKKAVAATTRSKPDDDDDEDDAELGSSSKGAAAVAAASRGAPHVDLNKRKELREEIQQLLSRSGISRQDLAPSIVGLGFWMRSLIDSQETIARRHLPFAATKRELNALCAFPLAGKFCRAVVDWSTTGTLVLGDDSAQQVAVDDMLPGIDLVDAVENVKPLLLDNDIPFSFSQPERQLVLLPALRRHIETVFAHVFTSLFIEGHAARILVGNRLVFLLVSLVLQHLIERQQCVDLVFSSSSSSSSSPESTAAATATTTTRSFAAEKKIMDPRAEMSAWVLPFTCDDFRPACFDAKSDTFRTALLDRIASYSVVRQPHAIYFDQSSGGVEIATEISKRIQNLLASVGASSSSSSSSSSSLVSAPLFIPVSNLYEKWPDEVHAPYVTFFGPKSWETSRLFRKQLVADVSPISGVRTTRKSSNSSSFLLTKNTSSSSSNNAVTKKEQQEEEAQKQIVGGRKRRATPGLVDRSADVTFHHTDITHSPQSVAAAATTSSSATVAASSMMMTTTPKPLSVIGINVDAKILFRAYPELRTPCGAGNSFRYRSVARCVVRRKFLDEYSFTGGPVGDPILVRKQEGRAQEEEVQVQYPKLLAQERVLEYFCGRAKPYQAVPALTAKLGF